MLASLAAGRECDVGVATDPFAFFIDLGLGAHGADDGLRSHFGVDAPLEDRLKGGHCGGAVRTGRVARSGISYISAM